MIQGLRKLSGLNSKKSSDKNSPNQSDQKNLANLQTSSTEKDQAGDTVEKTRSGGAFDINIIEDEVESAETKGNLTDKISISPNATLTKENL
mgnify:CR=1 FL=1